MIDFGLSSQMNGYLFSRINSGISTNEPKETVTTFACSLVLRSFRRSKGEKRIFSSQRTVLMDGVCSYTDQ